MNLEKIYDLLDELRLISNKEGKCIIYKIMEELTDDEI